MAEWQLFNQVGAVAFLIPFVALLWLLLRTDSRAPALRCDAASEDAIPVPPQRWSWAGFLLGPIWGPGNRVYEGLLVLVPILGLIMQAHLGRSGRKLSWNANRWPSVAEFDSVQRTWNRWSIAFVVILLLWFLGGAITALYRSGA